MKKLIDVQRGEVMAGQGEVMLKSEAQGACLVIAAYDAKKKIGGLAHAMFLNGSLDKKHHSSVMRDAASAVDEMITDMTMLGSSRDDIEVSLITGENVRCPQSDPTYERNISSAIEILRNRHIKYADTAQALIGDVHVTLDVATGTILRK